MFAKIYFFELQQGFRKPATYLYFALLFAMTLLIGLASVNVFSTTRSDTNTLINSAYAVSGLLLGMGNSLIGLLTNILLITIVATAIQKDYAYNMHALFFTKPITKAGYFWGRYLGATTIALFVFSGLLLGYFTGTLFGRGQPQVAPFNAWNYLEPFLVFTVPSIFLSGVIFFSVTTYTRRILPAYIIAFVLMVLQLLASTLGADIEKKTLAAMLEPTGSRAFQTVTEYWTPADKNFGSVPLTGVLLYNRLLWAGISLVICLLSFYFFKFSQFLEPVKLFTRIKKDAHSTDLKIHADSIASLPATTQVFTRHAKSRQFWHLVKYESMRMMQSVFYIIMCILGLAVIVVALVFSGRMLDTPSYPVTSSMLGLASILSGFYVVYILFYSGGFIWRDRETRMDELTGVTPVSNYNLFFSKWLAFIVAAIPFIGLGIVATVIYQFYEGFYAIDLGQIMVFIVESIVELGTIAALCLAIQVYASNKYVGIVLILIPLMIIPMLFSIMQWNGDLISYGSSGNSLPYSDLNKYGNKFLIWPFYKVYWLSIGMILALIALIVFARGKEKSLKARWNLSVREFTPGQKRALYIFPVLALLAGGFIAYQTLYLRDATKPKVYERLTAEAEKKYKRYEKIPQPRITSTRVNVDIYPSRNQLHANGVYTLKNIFTKPIDTFFINYPGGKKTNFQFNQLEPSINYSIITHDTLNGYKIVKLKKALLPGDTMQLNFDLWIKPRGLFDRVQTTVINNGTFIHNTVFPSVGYNPSAELSENTARKEYGLPPKPRMAKVNDSAARMNNYISQDADWMNFETTVSTDEGQVAIAPGYLQKDWVKDGRHYFHYKMDSPILNFYAFLSARYTVKRENWQGVSIEIYYHKKHDYNVDRMIRAIKQSLDYYTKNFGPYQHRQMRIIEFPNYAGFAQSFPNTVPYSESIGFLTRVKEGGDNIDVPFYVTSHEVAHQWWGHQVVGGNVQGSVLMSETLSQYSALMVMEHTYGKDAMRKFLKHELNSYLRGRTFEGKGELPLMLVENQSYIHYNKGSLAMYALKDYLGEERLNNALRAYLGKNKFTGPIYTNSIEFVNYLKAATPDSLQYLVTDLFEKITLYENYVKNAVYKKLPGNQYEVTLTVGSAKFYSDSTGKEIRAPATGDYVDIGVFKEQKDKEVASEEPLFMQKFKLDKPEKTFIIKVNGLPGYAGIDPYLKLVDKTSSNNTMKFGETPPKVDLKPGAKPGFDLKF